MRIIQNLSIRNKLIGIILLVTMLALGSGFTFVIINDIRSFKGEMKNYTVASAQVIGDYCVSPLLFGDRSGAEQILAKFAAVPPIINAIVYDTNEEPFAMFSTSEDAEIMSPTLGESSSKFVDDYLHVFQPIFYKDEYYGTIYLHVSTQLLNEKITNYVRYMVLLIAGLIVVSILLAESTQKLFGIHYEDTSLGASEPEEVPILQANELTTRERDVLAGKSELINRDEDLTDVQGIPFGYDSRTSRSLMFVPIHWEDRSIGILSVQSYTSGRYGERELKLLQTFADQCGGALVRVRAQEALRESEHGLAEAQRIAHLGNWDWNIITDELLWSDEIYRIFGLHPQEFGATNDAFLNSVHPDDRESVEEAVNRSLADPNVAYNIEHRVARPDDSEHVVHEQGEVILDDTGKPIRMVGTVLDITKRVRAEEERESLRRLSQRLTGPLTVKEVGRIVAAESRRLFGYDAFALDLLDESTQKLFGIYYEDTPPGAGEPEEVPTLQADELTPWKREVLAGTPKLLNRDKDPTDLQAAPFGYESRLSRSLMFVPVFMDRDQDGQISEGENETIGMLSVQNYTPDRYSERDLKLLQTFADQCGGALVRAQAEQELKDKQAQLMQSQKMASLGMLVAGVAHEINTPVGAISSMHDTIMRAVERLKSTLETIGEGEVNERRNVNRLFKIIEDGNRVITSGTERVTNIVRRLRSFARLDEAELNKVDIHEGIEDTLTIVHHELKHRAVVERNFEDIPPIACYPGQLNQVYVNLLINAVQAIQDKGTITITTFQKNDHVHIQIKDTGVGIPKELLGKIFDPGVTTKGVGVGTGLGLSICYQIIKDHHGEILVESEVGKGTTFTVVLPTNLDALVESQVSPQRRKERGEGLVK